MLLFQTHETLSRPAPTLCTTFLSLCSGFGSQQTSSRHVSAGGSVIRLDQVRRPTGFSSIFPSSCEWNVTLSGLFRVDPWECYQDTWQTTCSVLEHHRDLMKVSYLYYYFSWTDDAVSGLRVEVIPCSTLGTWPLTYQRWMWTKDVTWKVRSKHLSYPITRLIDDFGLDRLDMLWIGTINKIELNWAGLLTGWLHSPESPVSICCLLQVWRSLYTLSASLGFC